MRWQHFIPVLLLTLLCPVVQAEEAPIAQAEEPPTGKLDGAMKGREDVSDPGPTSVGTFLNHDGRFDLDAARMSGFQGAIDPSGFDVRFDDVTGEPIFVRDAKAKNRDPGDEYWADGFNPRGTDEDVEALAVWNGSLVLGGRFYVAGDQGIIYAIARWDGTSWYALGDGMNANVRSLGTYNGDLIAGGFFTRAGGVDANAIARWDGSTWHALGTGLTGPSYPCVWSISEYGGDLIAGGWFDTAGGVPASYIARWDGANWHAMGDGVGAGTYDTGVYALVEYNSDLIVGRQFNDQRTIVDLDMFNLALSDILNIGAETEHTYQ